MEGDNMKLQLSLADIAILFYILNWDYLHKNNKDVSIEELNPLINKLNHTNHEISINKFNTIIHKPYQPYIFYKSATNSFKFNPNISKTEYMSFISFIPKEIYEGV